METLSKTDKTKETYGYLWTKDGVGEPLKEYHFNKMQEVIPEKIVRGEWGIDIGSGCGYDTYIMASNNPSVKIVSMDLSDGVRTSLEVNRDLANVFVIKCSALNMPFKDNVFDFAYSFGAIHHTPSPKRGLAEISRVLRKNCPAFLYLYEDHSENKGKFIAIKIVNLLRKITIRIPRKVLFTLSLIASPFIFTLFTLPAKVLYTFNSTRKLAEKIPFNFGDTFFSLRWDIYDRFGAPIEFRFSRKEICKLLSDNNLLCGGITRLKATAGWVAWGYKNRSKD